VQAECERAAQQRRQQAGSQQLEQPRKGIADRKVGQVLTYGHFYRHQSSATTRGSQHPSFQIVKAGTLREAVHKARGQERLNATLSGRD
jgi:hypothetical protein